jgi:hypothetical protein
MGAALKEANFSPAAHRVAGAILYSGHCYDRQMKRCRVYAVASGDGGMEWRIVRVDGDGEDSGVERCFGTYSEAMRWIA